MTPVHPPTPQKSHQSANENWEDELREAFLHFDEDGSGTIDTGEIVHAMTKIGQKLTQQYVWKGVVDTNAEVTGCAATLGGTENCRQTLRGRTDPCTWAPTRSLCCPSTGAGAQFTARACACVCLGVRDTTNHAMVR